MTAEIRAAAPADAALLAALHEECFADRWGEAGFRSLLEDATGFGFLAALDSTAQFSSFVIARVASVEAEILTLGTSPQTRGQGLAARLLSAAAIKARQRGAEVLFLEVAEANHAAIGLYEKHGFAVAGRRLGYYVGRTGPALAALAMRMTLRDG